MYNFQGIEGAGAVARSVAEKQEDQIENGQFSIFPVPMRVESSEKEKRDNAHQAARKEFDDLLDDHKIQKSRYWSEV